MYDPSTLVCSIRVFGRRVVEVWHVDPERDGSDDSCGWTFPRLSDKQKAGISILANIEAAEPWYLACRRQEIISAADAVMLARQALRETALAINVKVSTKWMDELAIWLVCAQGDNIRSMLAFSPGYHSSSEVDREEDRVECALGLFHYLARRILQHKRSWWQHPRWHIHHWRFRFPIVRWVRRKFIKRCYVCDERLKRYESIMVGRQVWCDACHKKFESRLDEFSEYKGNLCDTKPILQQN